MSTLLDNDLYKFTMQQAVIQKFPRAYAQYMFINRGGAKFPEGFGDLLQSAVWDMKELEVGSHLIELLGAVCPYLTPPYLDFLKGYRYNPSEVEIVQTGMDLDVIITGPWYRTILWEVPLMARISALYLADRPVDMIAQRTLAKEKWTKLVEAGIKFADFGTRRRFSTDVHSAVVQTIAEAQHKAGVTDGRFVGSSNVEFALLNDIRPIGTQAHEWFMFHGARYGYRHANHEAMRNWVDIYDGELGIALSDTFTTEAFRKDFSVRYARLFDGVRHDSGDPVQFAVKMATLYNRLGIDTKGKTIVFSDTLTTDTAIELKKKVHAYPICRPLNYSCGIGTHFTNDVPGVDPLNIVIKMTKCKFTIDGSWVPTIKLSDVEGKHTGDPIEIELCKASLRL